MLKSLHLTNTLPMLRANAIVLSNSATSIAWLKLIQKKKMNLEDHYKCIVMTINDEIRYSASRGGTMILWRPKNLKNRKNIKRIIYDFKKAGFAISFEYKYNKYLKYPIIDRKLTPDSMYKKIGIQW